MSGDFKKSDAFSEVSWLKYPRGFELLLEKGYTDFSPWKMLEPTEALSFYRGLRSSYPRELFPIAWHKGSDDTACIEKGCGEVIKIINGYTSSGRETIKEYATFVDWFKSVIEDMIERAE